MASITTVTRINPSFSNIGNSTYQSTKLSVTGIDSAERAVITRVDWQIFRQSESTPIIDLKTTSSGVSSSIRNSPIIVQSSLFVLDLKLDLGQYYDVRVRLHSSEDGVLPWTQKVKFKSRNSTYRRPGAEQKVTKSGRTHTVITAEDAYKKQSNRDAPNTTASSSVNIGSITSRCNARNTISQYDDTTEQSWKIGTGGFPFMTGIFNQNSANNTYHVWLDRLYLEPGDYSLTEITIAAGYTYVNSQRTGDGHTLSVWSKSGTIFTRLGYVDLGVIPNTSSIIEYNEVLSTPIQFTIESGGEYYWAFGGDRQHPTAGPAIRYLNGYGRSENWTLRPATSTLPSSMNTSVDTVISSTRENVIADISVTSKNRKVFSQSAATGDVWFVPKLNSSGAKSFTKISDVTVAAGNSITIGMGTKATSGDGFLAKGNVIVDMGTPDQMKFGPDSSETAVNLNDGQEVGDGIDLGIDTRQTGASAWYHDLFYVNRDDGQGIGSFDTRDVATFSHWAKDNSSSPADDTDGYTFETASIIDISGTGTLGDLEVGWEPVICLGDSQAINVSDRLGSTTYGFPVGLTYERIEWNAGIGGGFWIVDPPTSASTRIGQRYKNDTPGLGDLAYIRSAVLILAGAGVNGSTSSTYIADITSELEAFFTDVANATHAGVIFLGLPTVPEGTATQLTNLIELNEIYHSEAVAQGYGYYNPYWVTRTNADAYTAGAASSYFNVDGIHYKAEGTSVVVANAVSLYESNLMKKYADC